MAEPAWQQDTNLHMKPHPVIPTQPFLSFSTAIPALWGRAYMAAQAVVVSWMLPLPLHAIFKKIFLKCLWAGFVQWRPACVQVWGTKDVQVIISEVTFPPVQSRKAGREGLWGCGPAHFQYLLTPKEKQCYW